MERQKTPFFKYILFSFKNIKAITKNNSLFLISIYTSAVLLSCLSHYLSYAEGLGSLSLILPLCLQILFFAIIFFSAFFILPYFFQKHLNRENKFFTPIPRSFTAFAKTKNRLWFKEMSQVIGLSYLWAFLFIVPGVIKLLHYSFVSYIVLFKENKIHPRQTSLQYSQDCMTGFICLFLLFIGGFYFLDAAASPPAYSKLSWMSIRSYMIQDAWTVFYSFFLSLVLHSIYLHKEWFVKTLSPPAASTAPQADLSL